MGRSSAARFAPAVIAAVVLAGCGAASPAAQDLCARYADVKAALADLRALPPLDASSADAFAAQVEDLRAKADRVKDTLDQVQRVSDGRLDTAIANARAQADALRESLMAAKYDAAASVGPQVAQAQGDLRVVVAPLAAALDVQCPS
jgi:hypothetical protein